MIQPSDLQHALAWSSSPTPTESPEAPQNDEQPEAATESRRERRKRERASGGDSMAIYTAMQKRYLNLRNRKKRVAALDDKVKKEMAELESYLLEKMAFYEKDRDYQGGHCFSVTQSTKFSVAASDGETVVPLLQAMDWDKPILVNEQSLTSLIAGKIKEAAEHGKCEFGELSEGLGERVSESLKGSFNADMEIEFRDIADEELRAEVIRYVGTPAELRPYVKSFTVTKLGCRKS